MPKHQKHPPKSSAAAAQRERIVQALRGARLTTHDLRRMGIFQVSTRIHELRQRGYLISKTLVQIIDSDGWPHNRVARYCLESEPIVLGGKDENGK